MKKYCVDCHHLLRRTVYRETCPPEFYTKKVKNVLERRGRAVLHYCRISGAYYLNTHRIYELEACKEHYNE